MASNVSVPNSFSNGTTADAPEVNANFAALVSWINTNAMHVDGSKAFAGTPSGPAADPTTANQLTRKAYVDAKTWATANYTDDSVTNAKLANVATATLKGRLTAGTGDPEDLLVTAVAAAMAVGGDVTGTVSNIQYGPGSILAADLGDNQITNDKLAASQDMTRIKSILRDTYCGRAVRAASLAVSNDTTTIVIGDTETYDPSTMHSTSTGHVTIPANGVYHMAANIIWPTGSSVGYRQVELRRYAGGGALLSIFAADSRTAGSDSADYHQVSVSGDIYCDASDILRVHAYQNSGGTLTLPASALGAETNYSWHCIRLT
jgi:hypothetical protein